MELKSYTGQELRDLIATSHIGNYRHRFCYEKLRNFVKDQNDIKVMSLYGLRHTGKTVMMLQMIKELDDYDNICLIRCIYGNDIYEVDAIFKQNKQCRYFFLDEVTILEDFINCASVFSNIYSESYGKKIVMTGDDSLSFLLARRDELYGCTHMIHTTYIPFKEYNYLLGRGLDDYIRYGGTLTDGSEFYNGETCKEYTNSAIAENIQHSLDHMGRDGEYGILSLYRYNDELTAFINKIVEMYTRKFMANVVRKTFVAHDVLNTGLRQAVLKALETKDPLINKATLRMIEEAGEFLKRLDVIYILPESITDPKYEKLPEEVIFMQPGLVSSQAEAQAELLTTAKSSDFLPIKVPVLKEMLLNGIKEQILQDIILYQLCKDKTFREKYYVNKYVAEDAKGGFDVFGINKHKGKSFILEVKHSTVRHENQASHLLNPELWGPFEYTSKSKICARMVIYMGPSGEDYGVDYVNAEEFLKNPIDVLESRMKPENEPEEQQLSAYVQEVLRLVQVGYTDRFDIMMIVAGLVSADEYHLRMAKEIIEKAMKDYPEVRQKLTFPEKEPERR